MRRWNPVVHDPILTDLVSLWKRTDGEIADEMGFDILTIGKHRSRLKLERVIRHRIAMPSYGPPTPPPKERPSPISVAAAHLGSRLVEKPSGYWIDGRPVNLITMMQETNRIRVGKGMPQIGPDGWRVAPA